MYRRHFVVVHFCRFLNDVAPSDAFLSVVESRKNGHYNNWGCLRVRVCACVCECVCVCVRACMKEREAKKVKRREGEGEREGVRKGKSGEKDE